MADRARQKTDKQLKEMERAIGRIYSSSPALKRIHKKYMEYMKEVDKQTKEAYKAYKRENDISKKEELKKEYIEQVKGLTLDNKEYKKIVSEFTRVMAEVNQQAIDYMNGQMKSIYIENYNQVAVNCREVGIKVNGED